MPRRSGGQGRKTLARSIALGGVFSAIAMAFLLAGGLIPIGTFAAPIFAGICFIPIAIDVGTKWALLCYVAVSILSALTVPDQELVLFFIVLLGYYPILHPTLYKIKNKALRMAAKLAMFNAAVAIVYSVLLFLLASPALQAELAKSSAWYWGILLLGGNATFVLYDIMLEKVRFLYVSRVRRHLLR